MQQQVKEGGRYNTRTTFVCKCWQEVEDKRLFLHYINTFMKSIFICFYLNSLYAHFLVFSKITKSINLKKNAQF